MSAPKKKEEGSPNLKKYLIGTGAGTATSLGNVVAPKLITNAAKREGYEDLSPHMGALYDKIKREAKVPVLENDVGPLNSFFAPQRMAGMGAEIPNVPHVQIGSKTPSILAHELGHAELHHNRLGHLMQNMGTTVLGKLAPALAPLGGVATGLSTDDERIHRAAIAAPALLSLPMLGSEAGASISALRRLRASGASKRQMMAAARTLAPAFGTYALNTAGGAAGAYAGLGIGGAIRRKLNEPEKEKKAMDDVTMAAFADELHKIGGFFDAAKNLLTTPIPGTPDLLGGAKASIEKAVRGGAAGKGGPSAGFQKFQQQRAAAASMPKHAAGTLGPQGINAAVRAGGLGLTRKNVLGAMMHPSVSPDLVSSIHRAAMSPQTAGPLNEAFAGHVKSMFQGGVR